MNSFISWIGGKKLLRKKIMGQFPEYGTYERYIEVFGGAGWVLFNKDRHAAMEVFNDVNGELINLYRVVKFHHEELQKELDWLLVSREQFLSERNRNLLGMTDIQRAARYFILIKESFGSDCDSFGIKSRNMQRAVDYLKQVSDRLTSVIIENVDFERLIKIYDRESALFYLDPPYYDAEHYYPDRFNPEDHMRLKNKLDSLKGKFVLSYNDCQDIRCLYQEYAIIKVNRFDNLVSKNGGRQYKELIIKNF